METFDTTNYLLDKIIWSKYDMVKTKKNVTNFLREYKESKSLCIRLTVIGVDNMSTNYDPNKTFSKVRPNNGGFADKSNKRMDAEQLVKNVSPIICEVKKTFTEREKIYYDYCLAENRSESEVLPILERDSKIGLKPIKNSCLLKIAFAFNLEVPIKKTSL